MAAPSPAPTKHGGSPARKSEFYDNALFSDVEIKFSGNTFRGHRFILCTCSAYFNKALSGSFIEAQSKVIDLGSDDDPKCIRDMLRFIYGIDPGTLSAKEHQLRVGARMEDLKGQLLYNVKLFATADKYDVPSLRSRIVLHVRCRLDRNLPKEDYGSPEFLEALRDTSTYVGNHDLHNALFRFSAERIVDLMNVPAFEEMLKESPLLSVRLLGFAMERLRDGRTAWCCCNCDEIQDGPGQCANEDCEDEKLEKRRIWYDG